MPIFLVAAVSTAQLQQNKKHQINAKPDLLISKIQLKQDYMKKLEIIINFVKFVKLEILKRNNSDIIFLISSKKVKKPQLNEETMIRMDRETCELFHKKSMKVMELTKPSREIIDKCDGSKTVEEICKEIYKGVLLNKFIEDSTIFLDKLNKEGFITWK